MKLGKTLDLSKCFYDKDHWTHPDLKMRKPYIVIYGSGDEIRIGKFGRQRGEKIIWFKSDSTEQGFSAMQFGFKKQSPLQEGWKHIQEVIE